MIDLDILDAVRTAVPTATVVSQKPSVWPANLVLITRAGGRANNGSWSPGQPGRIESANFVIQVWSDTQYKAGTLAETVRDFLWGLGGSRIGATPIYNVQESAGLSYLPDASAPAKYQQRYTFGVSLRTRKA